MVFVTALSCFINGSDKFYFQLPSFSTSSEEQQIIVKIVLTFLIVLFPFFFRAQNTV